MGHAEYKVRQRRFTVNESDRKQWVSNDEYLYRWYLQSRVGLSIFVRKHRVELNNYIRKAVGL